MKKPKRILCAVLALLMLLGAAAAVSVRPAYATKTEAELEEEQRKAAQVAALEQKKKEQQEKLKELEKQIAEAKAKKNDVMATKNLLDQRNQLLLEQIDDTQNQIDDAAVQIARYELLEEEQYTLFCQQVREEEERGSLSYLSVLFKATSMADLLNRMEFVNEVAEYNKRIISALQETRENIKAEKAEMEAKETQLSEQQDELQGKLDETTKLMNEYAADQKALEQLHDAEAKAADEIDAQLEQLIADSDVVPSNEGFIWPVSTSKKISSPVGSRVAPGGFGSTNHKGVDICAAAGTPIYASAGGTVTKAGYNKAGAGNIQRVVVAGKLIRAVKGVFVGGHLCVKGIGGVKVGAVIRIGHGVHVLRVACHSTGLMQLVDVIAEGGV